MVQLARGFDMLIACDDVYDMLQWPVDGVHRQAVKLQTQLEATNTTHLPRLVDVTRELEGGAERPEADGFGNVLSNSTISKIAGPGLRVGWAEGTAKSTYGLSQAGVITLYLCSEPLPGTSAISVETYKLTRPVQRRSAFRSTLHE